MIWTEIVEYFPERNSGFTRIIPLSQRKGDMAKMVRLEWTEIKEELKKEDPKIKKNKKVKKVIGRKTDVLKSKNKDKKIKK